MRTAPELLAVKRAAGRRRRAHEAYRAAALAAARAGYPPAAIARAAGITRQSARELIDRAEA